MIRSLILALTTALAITPAFAQTATWGKFGNWTVTGNSQSRACMAMVPYADQVIGIAINGGVVNLIITGVRAQIGKIYEVQFTTTAGETFTLVGVGRHTSGVVFPDITRLTLNALRSSRGINIQGLGTFNLDGSNRAIVEAGKCYVALNGGSV